MVRRLPVGAMTVITKALFAMTLVARLLNDGEIEGLSPAL